MAMDHASLLSCFLSGGPKMIPGVGIARVLADGHPPPFQGGANLSQLLRGPGIRARRLQTARTCARLDGLPSRSLGEGWSSPIPQPRDSVVFRLSAWCGAFELFFQRDLLTGLLDFSDHSIMKKICALFAVWFGFMAATIHAATLTNIEYGKAGGEILKLDACIPDGPGPFPAVILIHGGSWTGGDKSPGRANDSMSNMFDALTRGGFAWFAINYRLAPKYRYPADLDDVTTSIRWVKEHAGEYHVDPKRVAISGHSAGGHLAALAAVRANTADQVAAVVCFSTPFDLVGTPKIGDPMNPGLVPLFGFTNLTTKSVAIEDEASPITYVKSGLPPFLILQGLRTRESPIRRRPTCKIGSSRSMSPVNSSPSQVATTV